MTALLQHTFYITVTAVVLLLFKGIFKQKLSAKWQVWLWVLLLIRVAFPTLPQSHFSVFNAIPPTPVITVSPADTYVTTGPDSTEKIPASDVMPKEVSKKPPQRIDWWKVIPLSGSAALFFYFLIAYFGFQFRLQTAVPISDEATLNRLEECKKILGITHKVSLLKGEKTPMLTGVFRPKLLLPDLNYSPEEQRSVFLHELCHLKHHDIRILWLGVLVLCLNWYNPVIWYCFFVLRRDIEVYCDARVMPHIENKKAYATLLLKTALPENRFILGTTSLQNGKKEVERRIRYLAYFKKPKVIWTVILVLMTMVVGLLFLTNSVPDYTMSQEEYIQYINRPMGAIMAELDYADEDMAVFHYLDGLFVYDIKQEKLLHKFNLNRFHCAPHSQGDAVLSVTVSHDGSQILLMSVGTEDLVKNYENYLIETKSGKVKTTNQFTLEHPVSRQETEPLVPYGVGWIADRCIVKDEAVYFLSYQKGKVDNIHLNKRINGATDEYYPFHSNLTSIPGESFHFWSNETTYFNLDYPSYHDIFKEGKALGVAEEVHMPNLTECSRINNHSKDTTVDLIYGYSYPIYRVTETQEYPAASGNKNSHRMTMYFLEYPTKKDTYAVLFFETGMFDEAEVSLMLKSFTFTSIPELISREVKKHLKPNETVMVNSGMAWHIILEEEHLAEIEKLIRLTGYDQNFSLEEIKKRRIFDQSQFLDKNLYFYTLEIEADNGSTYPKLFIFNYDTAECLYTGRYERERFSQAAQLFIRLNEFTASEVKSALYVMTKNHLQFEYINAISPYYQCLSQEILNWKETGNEATFLYHTTDQHWNRDPDRVDYILKEKEAGNQNSYEILKENYLKPIESSFELKIVWNGSTPTLYHNSAPVGVEWTPVSFSDFVGDMPR